MKRHGISNALCEHPFMSQALQNAEPLIERGYYEYKDYVKSTGKRLRDFRKDTPHSLLPCERYLMNVFQGTSLITNTVDQMTNCQLFLHRFPSPRTYHKEKIGHCTWIEYHFGYYVILLVSLYDMALILTNTVFCLGNKEQNCKPDIIKSNDHLRGTSTKASLNELDKFVKPYRQVRNLHVHRGHSPDVPEILQSENLETLMMASKLSIISSSQSVSPQDLDLLFWTNTYDIMNHLSNDLEQLQSILSTLFDSLLPEYKKHTLMLHSKDGSNPS